MMSESALTHIKLKW